ncbi:MAG: hypothetical protein IT381_08825 [Deltaproteobacteria bacterium]|nr:hypothetical protein [Deltaproteobacteria bacterium]
MSDVVVIPAWRRADFLALTLERIAAARHSDEHHYFITLDRGFDPEVLAVAQAWKQKDVAVLARTSDHGYYGNSFNVLEGFRYALGQAARLGSRLIYTIEEDVWVAKDFFAFSRQVHDAFSPFAFSASVNQPSTGTATETIRKPREPEKVYGHPFFQSYGASFAPSAVVEILKHATHDYYRDMGRYVVKSFPGTGERRWEQDGLITRVIGAAGGETLYPYVPRAMHAGFHGYNRAGTPLKGTLDERIAKLREMDQAAMNRAASAIFDIEFCDFEGFEIDAVTRS